jgi:hypothetical protein
MGLLPYGHNLIPAHNICVASRVILTVSQKRSFTQMIHLLFIASTLFAMQDEDLSTHRQWRTPEQLSAYVNAMSSSDGNVSISTIGISKNGTPIQCIQVARDGTTPVAERSAILVVAGIDGGHVLGSEVATDLIANVLSRETSSTTDLIETHKLYIIPLVNPDVAHHYFNAVQDGELKNNRPTDDDHDGLIDEDGGDDLDGNGYITMMRVPDLEKATHLADPDESRLHIKPDPFKGQAASFVLYTEGVDDDNDGKFNEDGIGGVDLDKNFMHGYKIHTEGAGPWQLSECESKALADFVLNHQEIAAIVVYGRHDTLSEPLNENGKDNAGAPNKLDGDDVELYKLISERFNELTSLKNTTQPSWDGSFVAWAYAQYGVPSFSTPLWSRPEPIQEVQAESDESNSEDKPSNHTEANSESEETESSSGELTASGVGDISQETLDELTEAAIAGGYLEEGDENTEITPQEVEMYCKMMGIEVRRVKKSSGKKKPSSDDAAWLTYNDEVRDGEGFIEWTPYDHPQLGKVEIGGWVPYFKSIPPIHVIDEITDTQAEFLLDLASKLPDVHLSEPVVKKLGKDLWEIKVAVTNDGWFPTGTSMAKKNKRARPYIVRIDIPNDSIISGRKVNRIWSLAGGGTPQWFTWIIQGKPNEEMKIILFSEKFGNEAISVSLKNTKGGGA